MKDQPLLPAHVVFGDRDNPFLRRSRPMYRPTPQSVIDLRIRNAEFKRARKAEHLLACVAAGGFRHC